MSGLICVSVLWLTCACGAPPVIVSACSAEQTGGLPFEAEFELDCEVVSQNVALARRVLSSRGILRDDEFMPALGGTPVLVVSTLRLDAANTVGGEYNWFKGIRLGASGVDLFHEMLHKIDYWRGGVLSGEHFEWEKRGWYAADLEFIREFKSLTSK